MNTDNRIWSVRGAVQLSELTGDPTEKERDMIERVGELLLSVMEQNGIDDNNAVHIYFSQTEDLDFLNAATAARRSVVKEAVSQIPLFCSLEPRYPNALARTVRLMLTYYQDKEHNPAPVYLHGAEILRKDLFDG